MSADTTRELQIYLKLPSECISTGILSRSELNGKFNLSVLLAFIIRIGKLESTQGLPYLDQKNRDSGKHINFIRIF